MFIAVTFTFRPVGGIPMNGLQLVPVIAKRIMTLLPSAIVSSGVQRTSGIAPRIRLAKICIASIDEANELIHHFEIRVYAVHFK